MSASLNLLSETARKLFRALSDTSDEEAWLQIEETGLPLLMVSEANGGFGGDWEDAFAVLRLVGEHRLSGPLPDLILGRWAQSQAQFDDTAASVIALSVEGEVQGGRFYGEVIAPWSRAATHVLLDHKGATLRMALSDASVASLANPAGEVRDRLVFDGVEVQPGAGGLPPFVWGALGRTAQIAGALDAALALSIDHANSRIQFGKPIGKLQAVQQSLAEFAEEAAAVNCAGRAAARAADHGDCWTEVAAAKLRASQAAAIGARVAHQVHGAIGFTCELVLHRYTARLVSWRSEYGGERYWSAGLGNWAIGIGPIGLWSELVRRSDEQNKE